MLSTTYPVKLDRLKSWIDYEDPVKREPPIVPPVKIADEEDEVPKAKANRKGPAKSAKAQENPVPKSAEAKGNQEAQVAQMPEETSMKPIADERDDRFETEVQQEDFWSKLNRDFDRDARDDA